MKIRVVLLLCAVLFLNGCSSTEILYSHKEEGVTQKISKVFVFGAIKEPAFRKIFEQKLVAELKRDGLDALTTYDLFPDEENIDESEARAAIEKNGVDGVLVVRMIDKDKTEIYSPGMNVLVSNSNNSSWYGYYGSSYSIYSTPGRSYNYLEITAETVVFDVKSNKPVWTIVTQTKEEKKYEVIESYIKAIHKPLEESGLF